MGHDTRVVGQPDARQEEVKKTRRKRRNSDEVENDVDAKSKRA